MGKGCLDLIKLAATWCSAMQHHDTVQHRGVNGHMQYAHWCPAKNTRPTPLAHPPHTCVRCTVHVYRTQQQKKTHNRSTEKSVVHTLALSGSIQGILGLYIEPMQRIGRHGAPPDHSRLIPIVAILVDATPHGIHIEAVEPKEFTLRLVTRKAL